MEAFCQNCPRLDPDPGRGTCMACVWLFCSAFSPESGWTPVLKQQEHIRATALYVTNPVGLEQYVWMNFYLVACTFI